MPTTSSLSLPEGRHRLLLHSCCAPCACDIMLTLKTSTICFSVFFYNPNIHPNEEYQLRKDENIRFAKQHDIPFIDADYDCDRWFKRVKGLEDEPERGIRCTTCFDMRFEQAARYANEHGFDLLCSTIGISRWKDMDQVNASGLRATEPYSALTYWTYNWRKKGGSQRMITLAKQEHFYQQEYCGCVYSLRDTNRWRTKNGRPRIKRSTRFYGIPVETISEVSHGESRKAKPAFLTSPVPKEKEV